MIMTRETDYAVRILRALAAGERKNVRQICDTELVPMQFAYKILKKLKKHGLIEIFRGADGGCVLTADLGKVSLLDLLKCINEDICVNACMEPGFECQRRKLNGGVCSFHDNLAEVQMNLESELKKYTIASLMRSELSE